jgi:cell division protein FtsA
MHKDIICGLDIGSSSIRALVMESVGSSRTREVMGEENILGFSQSPTKGFAKGVVTNLGLLSGSIEDALSKVETLSHCKVRKIIANISGLHIRTFKSRGSVHISDRPSEITTKDLKRCIETAKLIGMSLDREVLHLIAERFYIDDKIRIDDPVGLFGSKLDIDLNIITSLVSILQNLAKAINLAGYEAEDMIISGAGTAFAIFDHRELEEGAVIIDVGKDLTETALFMDGKLQDCFYFPFGSDDLTAVLQDNLRVMFEEAEELRVKYGIVTRKHREIYDQNQISIPSLRNKPGSGLKDTTQSVQNRMGGNWVDSKEINTGTRLSKKKERVNIVSRRDISKLLLPKVEEIMQDVYKKIGPFLRQRKNSPHVSVVGGLSKMDGFIETIEEILGVPVEMARIRDAKDLHDASFACCLGLARYEARKRSDKRPRYISGTDTFVARLISRIQSLVSEYF